MIKLKNGLHLFIYPGFEHKHDIIIMKINECKSKIFNLFTVTSTVTDTRS